MFPILGFGWSGGLAEGATVNSDLQFYGHMRITRVQANVGFETNNALLDPEPILPDEDRADLEAAAPEVLSVSRGARRLATQIR